MLVFKTLPVVAAPKLLNIVEYCRGFGLFIMSWLVLSTVWPAGQGQWPPVLGCASNPRFSFTFSECNRTTSSQNGLDFSKDEGVKATGQQSKGFDFSGTTPLFEVGMGITKSQMPEPMFRACSALRGAQWPFNGSCLNVPCVQLETSPASAGLPYPTAATLISAILCLSAVLLFFCIYKYKTRLNQ